MGPEWSWSPKFEPSIETAAALATIPIYTLFYYITAARYFSKQRERLLVASKSSGKKGLRAGWVVCAKDLIEATVVEIVRIAFTVVIPARYVLQRDDRSAASIGIDFSSTTSNVSSAATSLLLAAFFSLKLRKLAAADQHRSRSITVHLIFNGLVFWEPFYCFCFLQLAFARAFGMLVAIPLVGISFGGYHLGTYPIVAKQNRRQDDSRNDSIARKQTTSVAALAAMGAIFALIFALSGGSLLVLWPSAWCVSCAIGTFEGGFSFGITECVAEAAATLAALIALSQLIL